MPQVTGIALAANQDGRLELLAILSSGREGPGGVWHAWQTTPNGDWTGWDPLGQPQSGVSSNAPAVARNADGRLEAVVITDDGTVWHRAQTAPGGSDWSEWRSLQRPGDQKATGTPVSTVASGRRAPAAGNKVEALPAQRAAASAQSAQSRMAKAALGALVEDGDGDDRQMQQCGRWSPLGI